MPHSGAGTCLSTTIVAFCDFSSSYNHSFIPLPLEGSRINKELATTFQPEAAYTSSGQRSNSISAGSYKTRYHEDYASNVVRGKDYRLPPFRPKIQKHVRDEDRLLYAQSITHESFRDVSNYHARFSASLPIAPTVDQPVYNLSGKTRYTEEFGVTEPIDQGPIFNHSTSSSGTANRVFGPSVPPRIRQFILENGPSELQEANVRDLMFSSSPRTIPIENYSSQNPYMSEFLNS